VIGDVMLDVLNWAAPQADARRRDLLSRLGVTRGGYVLATVHRSENTDRRDRLSRILSALDALNEPVVFPVHPRTRRAIVDCRWRSNSRVRMIDPVGYLDMVALTDSARLVLTDSGGLQKEAYWLGVPCVTVRDETEWVETVAAGWNLLAGTDVDNIVHAVHTLAPAGPRPSFYGDGFAAARCVALLGPACEQDPAPAAYAGLPA
jgi:UDP-N-acetylglucosamine 2-epimerase